MTKRIFRSILLAATAILIASLGILTAFLYDYFSEVQKKQLKNELELAVLGVEMNGKKYLSSLSAQNFRLTWISSEGAVLFDTQVSPNEMDNHLDREEIKEAMQSNIGESERYSSTLTEITQYYAARLSDGSVLRISVSQASVFSLLMGMMQPIAVICLLAMLVSAWLAHRMAKRIVDPLNELDLDHPLNNNAYEELSPLLNRINRQHLQINAQVSELQQHTKQFEQIIGCMKEGLVLLDRKRTVLSINAAAKKLFEADMDCSGKDFLTIDRSSEMNRAVIKALEGNHSEFRMNRHGFEYQFDISPIEMDDIVLGAVLLAFDVTQQASAEKSRQEFTANVSHELKTPLQTIIGSAELLETGLVKPEDSPRFIGHIRNEATRLVTLINDIIRLSQLDEEVELPKEAVDLREVAGEVCTVLTPAAEKKQITLSLDAVSSVISGIRRYTYEIIFNLCDNAIRYTENGGNVSIKIQKSGQKTILSVSDNGIGIPREHQARIFERFYRVDKSHSRETGGTGLGLSIVKHAVSYLGGQIKLESTPGVGTTVTVIFDS